MTLIIRWKTTNSSHSFHTASMLYYIQLYDYIKIHKYVNVQTMSYKIR